MINCRDIIEHEAISYHLDKSTFDKEIILEDKLGDRHAGMLDLNCFNVNSNSYVEILSTVYNDFENTLFEIGLFLRMPSNASTGEKHPILYKKDSSGIGYEFYENNGNLYLSIVNSEGTEYEVNTEESIVDWCDDNEHIVFIYRKYDKSNKGNAIIGISIYKEYEKEVSVPFIGIGNDANLFLFYDGINYSVDGVKANNLFMKKGDNLDINEYFAYGKCGMIADPLALYKLDEGVGRIVFDSSGYENHGKIVNYSDNVWDNMSFGVSYANLFGYSTGLYVKNKGVSGTINVLSESLTVEDEVIVPSILFNDNKDVFDNDLEYEGRAGIDIAIKDIVCFKANGSTYGSAGISKDIISDINSDWSFILLFDKIPNEGGTIFTYGQSPDYKLKVSLITDPYYDNIQITVGDVVNSYNLPDGIVNMLINFSNGVCDIDINNGDITDSFNVGNPTIGGSDDLTLFAEHDGSNKLTDANFVFAGLRKYVFTDDEKTAFFDDYIIPFDMDTMYVPMSHNDILFDVGKNNNHISLLNYNSDVWNGIQSEFPYFREGFIRACESRNNLSNYSYIPRKVNGSYIYYNLYGDDQLNIVCETNEGLLMYNYYINMSYLDKILGFFNKFFNKNSDVWVSLDSDYNNGNSYDWHIEELDYAYIQSAINIDYENFLFVKNIYRRGVLIGVKDMILMNTGLDIKPKKVNL